MKFAVDLKVQDVIYNARRSRSLIAFEGPNGVGKTTLVSTIARIYKRRVLTGPRSTGGLKGDPGERLQQDSERWLVERAMARKTDAVLLDRGWATIEVYRRILGRSGPTGKYEQWFLPVPVVPSLVVLISADPRVIDESVDARGERPEGEPRAVVEARYFETWTRSYRAPLLRVSRCDEDRSFRFLSFTERG